MDIKKILEKHQAWLDGKDGGERANLRGANLCHADLREADLCGADLCDANLSHANLCDADLCGANLRGANLFHANLFHANLRGANLFHANLRGANLSHANLFLANLRGANVRGANLSHANLCDADLRGAVLWDVIGNGEEIKSLRCGAYAVVYTSNILQIGCERHKIDEWWEFDEDRILKMDGQQAVDFWALWKPLLQQIIEASPATPTNNAAEGTK